jgi:predicted DNA-binding protein YlxM (UPF0122 family)
MLTKKQNIINRKVILLKSDLSIPQVAKKVGVSRVHVGDMINGYIRSVERSAKTMDAIISVINESSSEPVRKETFWPELYGANRDTETVLQSNKAA